MNIKFCPKCGRAAPPEERNCPDCGTKLENFALDRHSAADSNSRQKYEDQETLIARQFVNYAEYARSRIFCGKCGHDLCKKGEKVPDCPHCGAMENKG